ncbi:MAG: riboflavin kinase, partial [Paludibacter sp.]|nr:riboflavin kinase [Paludibacter sp.]
PTANLQVLDPEKMIPASAVYAVRVLVDSVWYGGMMNIGIRPTLNKDLKTSLEVNIFDYEGDIYEQEISVEFIAKIRNEQRFNSLDELVQQLHIDKLSALQLIELKQ